MFWGQKDKRAKANAAEPDKNAKAEAHGIFSTDLFQGPVQTLQKGVNIRSLCGAILERLPKGGAKLAADSADGTGMDSSYSSAMNQNIISPNMPYTQLMWYGSQGFIGFQNCAILAQNWLVNKACSLGARDAVRNGYQIASDNGEELDPEVFSCITELNKNLKLDWNLEQFSRNCRIFGIRVAIFKVDSDDPKYYEKPFNPDGVTPGSYRGIAQVDPYWVVPELDIKDGSDPSSLHFYEPTWWVIGGRRYHRSHLAVVRYNEVPDILKPSYLYGGVPLTQMIYERVYASERTANEAPMLAMTKRLNTLKLDTTQGIENLEDLTAKLQKFNDLRDNYGTRVIGLAEEINQIDTSLADLDSVIMTQYQLVAAIASVPATKLIGTTPKGFNATGEFEESSYHEELESIQRHEMQPLLDRHLLLITKSYLEPKFGKSDMKLVSRWNELDSPTTKEVAEVNKLKADTDAVLTQTGALDGADIRSRLISDPDSGYNGLGAQEVNDDEEAGAALEDEETA